MEANDYIYRRNEENKLCIAIEYLLDRETFRPIINLENKNDQTALIRATILNRKHNISALLLRGAKINYQNKIGKTALHYAALVGTADCTLLLLESGADSHICDYAGISAFMLAETMGFEHILKIMVRTYVLISIIKCLSTCLYFFTFYSHFYSYFYCYFICIFVLFLF